MNYLKRHAFQCSWFKDLELDIKIQKSQSCGLSVRDSKRLYRTSSKLMHLLFFKKNFTFKITYMCTWVQLLVDARRGHWCPWISSYKHLLLMWMLTCTLRSSGKAVCAHNCWAILTRSVPFSLPSFHSSILPSFLPCFIWDGIYAAKAGLELLSYCFYLPSAGPTGMQHHIPVEQ